ncbi:MAG: aminoacyl-tRNA hydrolase [Oscillospiraceae bacterium]|jgi:PTH1 family peptidyl-tRNA hydrolase|nr:aminoacyl-tRNA hydrolase [Oscillospiraceae bacterium]
MLIVGLGNPGFFYNNTRHNFGSFILNKLAARWGNPPTHKKFEGLYQKRKMESGLIILLQPQSFMNNSGLVVQSFAHYFKLPTQNIIVVHDDITLELGMFKVKVGGSSGGHNGIKSVADFLDSENFIRVKCGIGTGGKQQTELKTWVLSRFSAEEMGKIEGMMPQLLDCLECTICNGVDKAMNKYN